MCFGGENSSSNKNTETFDSALSILNRFKYGSKITQDKYIDPLGYEYNRSMVSCVNCIFSYGFKKCVLYKDEGYNNSDIEHIMNKLLVHNKQNCEYFLIEMFSEGKGDDDEIAKEAVKKIYNKVY